MSTKRDSYIRIQSATTRLHALILSTLREEPSLTRSQLAERTGLKLSSVCARVKELLDIKAIVVCGTAIDSDTDRKVQTLSVRK